MPFDGVNGELFDGAIGAGARLAAMRRHPDRAGRRLYVATVGERQSPTTTERVRLVRYTPAATLQLPYLRLHQFVYRHSGGLIGSRIVAGSQALLLTTTGRRSGKARTCALIYLRDGERLVVVASNGGSDHPPSWLLNLQAHPDVEVQIGLRKFSARASVASAEERERLWPRVNRHNMGLAPIMHPGARGRYDVYQRHTARVIPLVLLERNTGES
jgi:deazaflavin-dependent oxidoreductase (nitroreductase family)